MNVLLRVYDLRLDMGADGEAYSYSTLSGQLVLGAYEVKNVDNV